MMPMRAAVILGLALLAAVVVAQPLLPPSSGSTNFNATAATVSSANVSQMRSTSYGMLVTAGELVQELSGSSNYRMCIGWWCGINTMPYNISIAGKLSYGDGRPVANAPVQLSVWNNTQFAYSASGKTGSDGGFKVTIQELPTALFDAGYFVIELRASGEVEAVYHCLYNVSNGACGEVI